MMNKRIQELAKQAGGYVSLAHEHDGKLILSGDDVIQEFAHLLVRECVRSIPLDMDHPEYLRVMRAVKNTFRS